MMGGSVMDSVRIAKPRRRKLFDQAQDAISTWPRASIHEPPPPFSDPPHICRFQPGRAARVVGVRARDRGHSADHRRRVAFAATAYVQSIGLVYALP